MSKLLYITLGKYVEAIFFIQKNECKIYYPLKLTKNKPLDMIRQINTYKRYFKASIKFKGEKWKTFDKCLSSEFEFITNKQLKDKK